MQAIVQALRAGERKLVRQHEIAAARQRRLEQRKRVSRGRVDEHSVRATQSAGFGRDHIDRILRTRRVSALGRRQRLSARLVRAELHDATPRQASRLEHEPRSVDQRADANRRHRCAMVGSELAQQLTPDRADAEEDEVRVTHTATASRLSAFAHTANSAATQSSAYVRSRIKSSADSIPTERRTSESLIPAAARAAASIDACVIVAGCAIKLSTPPSDSARVKYSSADVRRSTPATPPVTSKLTIAPNPRCCVVAIS